MIGNPLLRVHWIGLEKAMNELNFKELIAEKAKEILSDNNFIADLAEKKIRYSLGLNV